MITANNTDDNGNLLPEIVYQSGRNWPEIIYTFQKCDKGYCCAKFPTIPLIVSNNINTKLLWITVSFIIKK